MFSQEEGERVGLDDEEEEEDVFEGGVPKKCRCCLSVCGWVCLWVPIMLYSSSEEFPRVPKSS